MNLKHLTDKTLLNDTKDLVGRERRISLEILHHLKEIERRRLFSELGYGSLFEYAVKDLGYSNGSAYRRIRAARMLKELPIIEKKIADGSLTLSNLVMADQLFKNEDIKNPIKKKEILGKIENATSTECSKTLLNYQSEPTPPIETMIQTTPTHVTVKFNLTAETIDLLEQIKQVTAHNRFSHDELLKRVFKIALEDFKHRKFKIKTDVTSTARSPSVKRYIPAIIKKHVYERDKGKCQKCGSKFKLEYDHIRPFAFGGETTFSNLRLLCFSCNQRRLI